MSPRSEDGAVARFLEEHGPGLYAVSLRVADVEAAREELAERGVESVGQFESGDVREVFFHPRHFEGALLVIAEYRAPHPKETAL